MVGLRLGAFGLLLVATGCGVTHEPGVAARVAAVSEVRLEQHLQALHAIGPRPHEDPDATQATLSYLTDALESFGYDVVRERFETRRAGRLVARVVPLDDLDAEPREIVMADGLSSAGSQALAGVSARFREQGLRVTGYSLTAHPDSSPVTVVNLFAERRGVGRPDRIVELSAHYDTVPYSPGADDNGSGVAALLEVARSAASAEPERTIRLCFFGAEEAGLQGSRHHVRALQDDDRRTVEGLLNLDGVGLARREPGSQRLPDDVPWFLSPPDTADFIAVVGNWSSGWIGNLFEDCADLYVPELHAYSVNRLGAWMADAQRSDHAEYWRAGYDAVFLSDTTEYRAATYHLPADVPETLDLPFLTAVTRATLATALEWADR